MRVATKTISGLYDGATTRELDQLSIQTAAALIAEEPRVRAPRRAPARRRTSTRKSRSQEIHSFSQSIARGHDVGPDQRPRCSTSSQANARKLNDAIDAERDRELRVLRPAHALRPLPAASTRTTRKVIETPQQFFLRIACALSEDVPDALELYRAVLVARVPAELADAVQLRHARTSSCRSCFLLDSPQDTLEAIYQQLHATSRMLSKFSGGIGLAYHRVRSRGSLIRGTNGHSNGIVPWLKTLDASVAAVNQGGKRKGACCVYLEPWHADIEEFLELRDNTGDEARRTHNLNLANWIRDLFMRRVEADGDWSLFDPQGVPRAARPVRRGVRARLRAGRSGRAWPCSTVQGARAVRAHDADAGADRQRLDDLQGQVATARATRPRCPGNVVHLSNLCTEILEVTSEDETAVCNLGSINLARHCRRRTAAFDFDKLARHRARWPCASSIA